MELKPMDESTRHAFCGAEDWNVLGVESPPMIGEGTLADGREYLVVFAPNGSDVLIDPGEEFGDELILALNTPIWTPIVAQAMAKALGEPKTVERFEIFGYTRT